MRTHNVRLELETRAAAALTAALGEVSTVKVKEIRHEARKDGRDSSLTAHVDVFGRRHVLMCAIHADGQPRNLIPALETLRASTAKRDEHVLPIVIAPYLSPEAQELCKQSRLGFVDLEGNARLALGEVFIVKRTLAQRGEPHSAAPETWRQPKREKYPARAAAPLVARPVLV